MQQHDTGQRDSAPDLFAEVDPANATATIRAIGYLRVSTEGQLDGLGLDVQRSAIEALAEAEGLDLVAVFTDEGISGSEDITGRRALADALDALTEGTATVLIVPKLDRLARDLMVQESVLADAWRTGADVLSCSETERTYCQPDNPDDPARTLIRQVLGAVAAYDRAMIRARLVAGRRRKIADVGYAGGPEPYGWSDPSERETLAYVAGRRQRGSTWQQIVTDLNASGRTKRNGKPWTPSALQRTFARADQRDSIEPADLDDMQGALL